MTLTQLVADTLIPLLMTVIAMMTFFGVGVWFVRCLIYYVAHRHDRAPLDDRTYDWKRMGELRTRFEHRDDR